LRSRSGCLQTLSSEPALSRVSFEAARHVLFEFDGRSNAIQKELPVNLRLASLLAVVACSSVTACGGKSDPPANSPPPNGMNGTPGGIPGADPGTGTTGAMTPGGMPAPGTPQPGMTQPGMTPPGTAPGTPATPVAGASGTATPVDPNMAAAASTALTTLGATEAPGAQKEGVPVAASFQAGQTMEQAFTMQPGKCYTVVASSMGVTQLDISAALVTPVPGMNAQFGQAKGKPGIAGSQAVLGAKTACLKLALSPFPVQAKFTVTATAGAGLAAAQLFVK
jgi:hypothetical protein